MYSTAINRLRRRDVHTDDGDHRLPETRRLRRQNGPGADPASLSVAGGDCRGVPPMARSRLRNRGAIGGGKTTHGAGLIPPGGWWFVVELLPGVLGRASC